MNIFFTDPTIWVFVSFAIFVVLAVVFGRATVLKLLDDKIASIRTEIANAEALRNEAQALLNEYEQKQKTALSETQRLIEDAKVQASDLHKRADQDLVDTIARREAMLKDRIQRMEETAIDDIRRYAADLAVSATQEIIAQKLDQSQAARLNDDTIRKVSENLN